MRVNTIAIICCFIICQCLGGCCAKKRSRNSNRYYRASPAGVSCQDRNLQRTVVWQPPVKFKQGWKLIGYTVERCVSRDCSYKTVQCYQDVDRTHLANTTLSGTRCMMSPANLLPWEIYTYKITALYRSTKNHNKTLSRSAHVNCEPVYRAMTLGAPHFELIQTTTSTISFVFKIPNDLEKAVGASHNYDLRIAYSFCLYESGKTCQSKDVRNESCNPTSTYSNLKEGKKYTILAWYTSRAPGKHITSAIATEEVQTEIDYFPPKSQILLVIGLSAFLILTIVTLVIWKTTKRFRNKWEALVHKEIPRYFEEALKDLSKTNEGFITHEKLLKTAHDGTFQDEEVNIAKMKVPGKLAFVENQSVKIKDPEDQHSSYQRHLLCQ